MGVCLLPLACLVGFCWVCLLLPCFGVCLCDDGLVGCYVIYYLSFNVDCVITLDLRLDFVGCLGCLRG